jgi:tetratricopeptide (TPR) repeat protein
VCGVLGVYFALRHLLFTRAVEPLPPAGSFVEGLAMTLTGFRDNLLLVLWPHPLRAVRTDYAAEAVFAAAVFVAALVALVVVVRRRARGLAFGLAFFLVALIPATRLVTRLVHAQPMAERYLYLPSVGLAVALGFGVRWLWWRVPRIPVIGGAVLLVGALGLQTRARNEDWHDSVALFRADVAARPDNGDALFLLAGQLGGRTELIDLCRDNIDNPSADNPQFFIHCAEEFRRRGELAEAERHHLRSIAVGATPVSHYTYARLLAQMGRTAEAEEQYRIAIDTMNDPVRRHTIIAERLLKLHPDRLPEALAEIDAALAADPSYEMARGLRRRIVALLDAAHEPPSPGLLSLEQRKAMHETLAAAGSHPVWLRADADATAIALRRELGRVFVEAGWEVREEGVVPFGIKPGVFLFMADAEPPEYPFIAQRALEAAGLRVTGGTDYRAYCRGMKERNPGFRGFDLAADQSYVVVVGRQ